MSKYDLVIFDLDGTLVDSRLDLAAATNAALRDLGLGPRPLDEIVGFIGNGLAMLLEQALRGPERVDEARPHFIRHYTAGLLDQTRPYPGVDAVVRSLGRGRDLAVATNKPGDMARNIVSGLGWDGLIPQVVGGGDVASLKPAPDMVEVVLERTGRRLDRTVIVGDMEVDLELARSAGTFFIGVSWGFAGEERLRDAGAERVVSSAAELAEALG